MENVILVAGLTLRELDRILFTDEDGSASFPEYMRGSGLAIGDWNEVVNALENLLPVEGVDFANEALASAAPDPKTGEPSARYFLAWDR